MQGWRRNLYVLWAANFVVSAGFSLVIPFLPLYIQEELGVRDPAQVQLWSGVVFAANFAMMAIFSPIWGAIADRTGRKLQMLRSGYGMSVAVLLMGLATSVWHLFGLRLLQGVFSGFIPAAVAFAAANTPAEHTGYALGILQTASGAGNIIGPLIGGVLAKAIGSYRPIFFLTAAACVTAATAVLVFVRERFEPPPARARATLAADLRHVVQNPVLLAMTVVYFLNFFGLLTVEPILTLFLKNLETPEHWVDIMAGAVFSAAGIATVISAPILGRTGDRLGHRRVLLWSLGAATVLYALQSFVTQAWQLLVLRFLVGLALGGIQPAASALVAQAAGSEFQGRAFGVVNSAVFLGNTVGPLAGGLVAGFLGQRMVFWVTAAAIALNILWVQRAVPEAVPPAPAVAGRKA
ncbi:MFS transporter [Caldinitratiruptor microaerophilus]|uniref:Multidrug resistance protein n=1 Tax=Caldinitratiruptor microaerophilus TaxID=671077 RepID=A0AA35CPK4_9FIRM|nr:MFS transporter [Caldinitratiruptor microaerophilus]BDG61677.1 multidrug resistance protein [Caldinitratiruptor microaerophilus]